MSTNRDNNRGDGRGFAGMDEDKQREIASKGGETVSQDREHMAEIGREGGHHSRGGQREGEEVEEEEEGRPRGGQGGNQGGGQRQR